MAAMVARGAIRGAGIRPAAAVLAGAALDRVPAELAADGGRPRFGAGRWSVRVAPRPPGSRGGDATAGRARTAATRDRPPAARRH